MNVTIPFFNFFNDPVLDENLRRTLEGCGRAGVVPLVVVGVRPGHPRTDVFSFWDNLVVVEGDCLWQKEALINIGFRKAVEGGEDRLVWLDGDIAFDSDDWAERLDGALETRPWAQPFSSAVRHFGGREPMVAPSPSRQLSRGKPPHEVALPGLVWGYRAELWEAMGGLYDRNVVGGGDRLIWDGLLGSSREGFLTRYGRGSPVYAHALRWAENAAEVLGGIPPEYLDIGLESLPHGTVAQRRYHNRFNILLRHGYNPGKDVYEGAGGGLFWSATAPAMLRQSVAGYLKGRVSF